MKTLRLIRNIAVLFILVMGLLASRPEPAVAHATGKSCGFKKGSSVCFTDANGNCQDVPCKGGKSGFGCLDFGCV